MTIPHVKNPFDLFREWFGEAQKLSQKYTDSAALATVDGDGMPAVRVVLVRAFDERGFVFYTNLQSDKGRQVAATGKAALCFYWQEMDRQIRVRGLVEQVSDAEADAYFNGRPRGSRIGAWASLQSRPIGGREELEARVRELEEKYEGQEIPRPPHWSGLRIRPLQFEFWREGQHRLHDRRVYRRRTLTDSSWESQVLMP